MALYKIHPLVLGAKIFSKGILTYQHDYDKEITVPVYGWLIEGGDKTILVDTGYLGPVITEAREKAIGGKIYRFEEALARWNLTPKDIDIVLHTHLHNDHCENDMKCVNATFYAHEFEFETLYNPHPLDFRYAPDFVEEIDKGGQMVHLKEDTEIVPGIRMVHTPAHTRGGMTVLVATEKGTAAITGFCTLLENFFPPKRIRALEWEVIPPGVNIDPYLAYEQVLRVKREADIYLPLHEPAFARIDTIPDDLEKLEDYPQTN
ncbi:N-acyl homoserine lactonase family protein [Thermosulfurimonas dismutans]|uniref:AiiA-like protein n=1 Tax=Thermosulfurimonas dismutans TaxID=999894 RepID=A0A179D5D1_9BACT|nr:N-acyl homoserine lactonase family protein [Thermosulfurimonas dismutans]OAQ20808.1 AiiA-like protein [Thermosulfurimonas dismutans]